MPAPASECLMMWNWKHTQHRMLEVSPTMRVTGLNPIMREIELNSNHS